MDRAALYFLAEPFALGFALAFALDSADLALPFSSVFSSSGCFPRGFLPAADGATEAAELGVFTPLRPRGEHCRMLTRGLDLMRTAFNATSSFVHVTKMACTPSLFDLTTHVMS